MNEETLFAEALGKKGETRALFLDEHCKGDIELRKRLEALLRASDNPDPFLDAPAPVGGATIDAPVTSERPGTVIGPYKLLQQIGEGGMGTVFMAEQIQPVQRMAALKVIKPGMDSRQVIARFEAERQALAIMDHVNIARVFDGGTTESGRPYFVMELVHGVPITKYCDDNQLTPRQRLELFVPVCQAIQHAHQKGIIHRDIKPSNVMITLYDGKPVPKVIDFGVAKATEQKLTERTLFTQYGTMVGTLEYMSPEQAEMSALGVDTRSDIYSLGVLLYELLTGSTPLSHKRVSEAAYAEILRLIKEEEPQKPSTRLSDSGEALASISAQRKTEPAKLSKLVRGELDWIVMRSLEKDRNRRYETANAFAADVQRYLNDETVQACPPSGWYRFRKFARRNKRALMVAAVLGTMLLLGVVLLVVNNVQIKEEQQQTAAQKTRAESALGEAKDNLDLADENLGLALEALDEVYMKEIEKRVLQKRELSSTDREFLQKGLRFYEEFGKRNSTHVGLQGATAKANRRAGYLRLELAQWQEAAVHFRKAIPLLEKPAGSANAADFRRELASACHGLSVGLRHTGPLDEAEAVCRQAIDAWKQLATEFPAEPEYRVQLGHSLWQLRDILSITGRHQEAEKALRKAIRLYEDLTVEFPKVLYYRQESALSRRHLAETLNHQGRGPEAVQNFRQAVVLYSRLAAESPANLFIRYELAFTYAGLGHALKASRQTQAAADAYREAIALHEKLAKEARSVAEYRMRLAWYQNDLANLFLEIKRFPEAERCRRRALDLAKELAAENRAEPDYWHYIGRQYCALAETVQASRRPNEVQPAYKEAVKAFREALPQYEKRAADSPTLENRGCVQDCLGWLASALVHAGQLEEAVKALRQSASLVEKMVTESDRSDYRELLATRHAQVGDLLKEAGRHQAAETAYRGAVAVWKKLAAEHKNSHYRARLAQAQLQLLEFLAAKGERGETAEAASRRRISALEELVEETPRGAEYRQRLALCQSELTQLLVQSKRFAEADLSCRRALDLYKGLVAEDRFAPDHWYLMGRQTQVLAEIIRATGRSGEVKQVYEQAVQAHRGALAVYEKRAADSPTRANYWQLVDCQDCLCGALRQTGQLDEAVKVLRAAVGVREKLVSAFNLPDDGWRLADRRQQLGDLLKEMGRLAEAETAYRDALAVWKKLAAEHNTPDHRERLAQTQTYLAYVLVQQGKHSEAAEVAAGLDHPWLQNNLAWWIVGHSGEPPQAVKLAVEVAKKAVAGAPDAGAIVHTLGTAQYRAGDWMAAIDTLMRAEELYGGGKFSFNALFLAMAHWQRGEKEQAVKWYGPALVWMEKYAPNNEELLRFRAEAAAVLGLPEKLTPEQELAKADDVKFYTLVLEARPEAAWAYGARGGVRMVLKQWDKARRDFEKATELTPGDALAQYRLALGCLHLGDRDGYRKACAGMVEHLSPSAKVTAAHWATAWTCVLAPDAVPDWKLVVQLTEKALAAEPNSFDKLNDLGAVLYRVGRFEEAAKHLTQANAAFNKTKNPRSSTLYTWLFQAMTQHRLGNAKDAKSWLDKAVRNMEQSPQDRPQDRAAMPWNRRLTLQLLRREVEELLKKESGVKNQQSEKKP